MQHKLTNGYKDVILDETQRLFSLMKLHTCIWGGGGKDKYIGYYVIIQHAIDHKDDNTLLVLSFLP